MAMFARVPDSMWSIRCEIGCPIVTFVPGSVENPRRSDASSSSREPLRLAQADVDLGRLDALHVLVELGAAGAPRRRDDFRLGEQDLLDPPADFVRLRERGAGQRVRLDRQAPFVELRQERRAHPGDGGARDDQQRQRHADHDRRMIERVRQQPREARLQRPRQPALVAVLDRRACGRNA